MESNPIITLKEYIGNIYVNVHQNILSYITKFHNNEMSDIKNVLKIENE